MACISYIYTVLGHVVDDLRVSSCICGGNCNAHNKEEECSPFEQSIAGSERKRSLVDSHA